MRCPKCNHEQVNSVECEACGIIFEKYHKFQEKKRQSTSGSKEVQQEKKVSPVLKLLQLTLLIGVVAGTTYYFTGYRKAQNDLAQSVQVSDRDIPQVNNAKSVTANPGSKPATPARTMASKNVKSGNPIQRARNATVSIETPWGTGSGFFISNGYIVTNRHVVELDEKKIAEFRYQVETVRQMVELEREKIRDWRNRMSQMAQGPSRRQLALVVANSEKRLQQILPKLEEGERKLRDMENNAQPSDIKIILVDGSVHYANYLMISENYDLALMSIFGGEWASLQRPPKNRPLQQGDKVYTVGSPVGLRHTVTSGIFSSYRFYSDGQKYLQTDAPINPGNSGGPLIDEKGYVHGVNTLILQNTEGIGFAIPIDVVYEEFSATLF